MNRREFITLIGSGLVACPVCGGAQQPTTPVIGFLSSLTASDQTKVTTAFRQGLQEAGYVLGQNVAIEYRWAEGQYNRLPALADDLVRAGVAVIAAISGTPSGLAAKAATTTIPIVFAVGSDPIAEGLVTSLSRPTGNVTGVTFYTAQLGGPRLGLLRELVPNATTIAILMNPDNAASVSDALRAEAAAQAIGQPTMRLKASTEGHIDDAFGVVAHQRISALFVSADPLYLNHRRKLVALAVRHRLPAIYADRELVESGGLISYGASRTEAYRLAGNYVGRILKGEKPANLPVQQPTKFELIVNLKAAKALGLAIPQAVLLRADEVIE